jgi:hypothetical protein
MGIQTRTSSGHLNKLRPAQATTIAKVQHLKVKENHAGTKVIVIFIFIIRFYSKFVGKSTNLCER